jgi:hypothetical protein
MTSRHRITLFLLCFISMLSFIPVSTIHAASFTAVQNGLWDSPATWGETVVIPEYTDDVTIPVGIIVTLDHDLGLYSGHLTINGTLNVVDSQGLTSLGIVDNYGTFNATSPAYYVNGGTFNNNGTFSSTVLFHNEGLANNSVTGTMTLGLFVENSAGATINNAGVINNTNSGGGETSNWGMISNTGTINNSGIITNYCSGKITGNTVSGNAPINHTSRPVLTAPTHRSHSTDTTPTFSWTNADPEPLSFRIMIYREDRSFNFKNRVFTTNYTLNSTEALATGRFLWRVRTQYDSPEGSCWTSWSTRRTIFID